MDESKIAMDLVSGNTMTADEFFNVLVRGYAVFTLGYFIYAGIDRLAAFGERGARDDDPVSGMQDLVDRIDKIERSEDGGSDGQVSEPEPEPEPEPEESPTSYDQTVESFFPISEAAHDVNTDLSAAIAVYHFSQATDTHRDAPWYIIMRYDQSVESFVYWCDVTPPWDYLQTCARKFVTLHRCAALYSVREVKTVTHDDAGDSQAAPASDNAAGDPGETPEAEPAGQEASVTTMVDNVYVRAGRLSAFVETGKSVSSAAAVDYKTFATLRSRGFFG